MVSEGVRFSARGMAHIKGIGGWERGWGGGQRRLTEGVLNNTTLSHKQSIRIYLRFNVHQEVLPVVSFPLVFDISTILIDSHTLAGYSPPLIRPHTIQMVARTAGKDVSGVHIPIIRSIQIILCVRIRIPP